MPLVSLNNCYSIKLILTDALLFSTGDAVLVWSMSTPEKDVYLMTKEIRMVVPKNFNKKAEQLYAFLEGAGN